MLARPPFACRPAAKSAGALGIPRKSVGADGPRAPPWPTLEPAVRTGLAGASAVSGVLPTAGTANPPGTGLASRAPRDNARTPQRAARPYGGRAFLRPPCQVGCAHCIGTRARVPSEKVNAAREPGQAGGAPVSGSNTWAGTPCAEIARLGRAEVRNPCAARGCGVPAAALSQVRLPARSDLAEEMLWDLPRRDRTAGCRGLSPPPRSAAP